MCCVAGIFYSSREMAEVERLKQAKPHGKGCIQSLSLDGSSETPGACCAALLEWFPCRSLDGSSETPGAC